MDWKTRSETYNNTSWVNSKELLYECLKDIDTYPNNIKILDAGAGTGAITNKLFEKNYKNITAFDKSDDMLKKIKYPVEKILGNIEKMVFKNNLFDYIFCRNVMQYVDYKKTINELIRISKLNGTIIISQAIPYNDKISNEYDYIINRNIHFPTENEIFFVLKSNKVSFDFIKKVHRLNINDWLKNTTSNDIDYKEGLLRHKNSSKEYKKTVNMEIINNNIYVDTIHIIINVKNAI